MPKRRLLTVAALPFLFGLACCSHAAAAGKPCFILSPKQSSFPEMLAAKEARRYIYLRTGVLARIVNETAAIPKDGDLIIIAGKDNPVLRASLADAGFHAMLDALSPQQCLLKTISRGNRDILIITGGDGQGALYGAYKFAEHLGVRFYLHGDTVPDARTELNLENIDITARPLFALRGILPFHDFPEGPDWWNLDDYKAVLAQLPKLGMNFFGLHNYLHPADPIGAEPGVWVGKPEDVAPDGKVITASSSSWMSTARDTWGYVPKDTGDYSFGASQLFEDDVYGPEVMRGNTPFPVVPRGNIEVFERAGDLLHDAFSYAHALGIKTCIGTETPLAKDEAVRNIGTETLYEGVFKRISLKYPLDYYWLWTPEVWTWNEVTDAQVKTTIEDLQAAVAASKRLKTPFTLATSGWVLGPPKNFALFDDILPKEMPFSAISRETGKAPVEPAFARISGRPKWAIPWLEDDPNLLAPQLWAGRMRKDAADALKYGCDGLMGIHWRTRILAPNISALAKASWRLEDVSGAQAAEKGWLLSVDDFYLDWAQNQFGPRAAAQIAEIFSRIDGDLPEPSHWASGPGGLDPETRVLEEVMGRYQFVDELAALREKVTGAGNLERFDYWLDSFRYMKAIERLKCAWGKNDRKEMDEAIAEVYKYLLRTVSTNGELGTVANWEHHLLRKLKVKTRKAYGGEPRIIVPTLRAQLSEGEPLKLKVIILSQDRPRGAAVYYRLLGGERFISVPLKHIKRGVYVVEIKPETNSDFEYYIEAGPKTGQPIRFPATAPALNQTVIILKR